MNNARNKAGHIITGAGIATSIAKTAAIQAAKLPASAALELIPLVGTGLGVAIDVIVEGEPLEQALESQIAATLAQSAVVGVMVVAGSSFLAIGVVGALTYVLVDNIIDYLDESKREILEAQKKMKIASTIPSPVALDINGDGITTTALTTGVFFDHAGDGFAEQTAWVSTEDGLLVRDLNGNGTIDTGAELFGSNTVLKSGKKAAHGFQALADLDSNKDGKIDASDGVHPKLAAAYLTTLSFVALAS